MQDTDPDAQQLEETLALAARLHRADPHLLADSWLRRALVRREADHTDPADPVAPFNSSI